MRTGTFGTRSLHGWECGLELNEHKTRIVYRKDDDRRGSYEHTSFDFLGYTFRPRLSKGREAASSSTSSRAFGPRHVQATAALPGHGAQIPGRRLPTPT